MKNIYAIAFDRLEKEFKNPNDFILDALSVRKRDTAVNGLADTVYNIYFAYSLNTDTVNKYFSKVSVFATKPELNIYNIDIRNNEEYQPIKKGKEKQEQEIIKELNKAFKLLKDSLQKKDGFFIRNYFPYLLPMLNRSISRWAMVLLVINGVIGSGVFGLPSESFNKIGVYSIAGFLVCALAVFVIILCFAEVSSRFDKTGGPYLYALSSFGPLPAFLTGWLLLLTRFITYAALINLLVTYLSVFSPWFELRSSRIITIVVLTLSLAYINHIGVKNSTRVNNFLTIAKLLPLLLFIIVGFFFVDPGNYDIKKVPDFGTFSSTVLLLVFAFGGFESVLVNSGEVKNPEKNLPFALLLAALIIAIIYMLVQIVSIGTLPTLAESKKPLAEAAGLFMGKTGASIIAFGAMCSVAGTLNAIMLVGSRLPFAFSEENQFPKLFSFIHPKHKTPTWSLLLFMGVTIIISLSYSFLQAASISAITRVMIYGIVCTTLIILRKKRPEQTDFFKIKYGNIIAVLGIMVSLWLLSSATLKQLKHVGIAVGIGFLIYIIMELTRKRSAQEN